MHESDGEEMASMQKKTKTSKNGVNIKRKKDAITKGNEAGRQDIPDRTC